MPTHVPAWLLTPADPNLLVPQLWSSGVAKGPGGELTVAGVPVSQIAREFGTPSYVVDEADLRARARGFKEAFAECDVFYAAKANLSVELARWIDAEGLGLDVCSEGELACALHAGFDPARIGFHGNNKSVGELVTAVECGVGRIIVDSREEIDRLAAVAADRRVVQDVLVRVKPGVEAHTHTYIATAHEDQKFGFSLDGEAAAAMASVSSAPSLRLRGLHSHIGSQIFDSAGFQVAVGRVLALYAEGLAAGMPLGELDIGGGFGIAYTTRDSPQDPHVLAASIERVVGDTCHALSIPRPRLSLEPGRAIAGPSTFTLYEVGTVKTVRLDSGGSRLYVAVDGGMSDNIRAALYGADFSCTLASRSSDAPATLARVVGKHCETGDVLVRDEFLPGDTRPGDLIAVPGTGAYCRSLASNYNHVTRPAVVAVLDGSARVIVRRETVDDLLRLDVT
ncbi:MAG: diaminopimelate decarboxylase [Nocardioidaceae bacterium]